MPAVKLKKSAPNIGGAQSSVIAALQAQLAACQARTIEDLVRSTYPTEIAAVLAGTAAGRFWLSITIDKADNYLEGAAYDDAIVSFVFNAPVTDLSDFPGLLFSAAKNGITCDDLVIQGEFAASTTHVP